MCKRLALAAALALASGGVCSHALAQAFVNNDFETGDLTGWTVTLTSSNAQTFYQDAVVVDIDGLGPLFPLEPSYAARFSVGQIDFVSGVYEGVNLHQPVQLQEGVTYEIAFNWSARQDAMNLTNNGSGGDFSILVDGDLLATDVAGSVAWDLPKYGFIRETFTATQTRDYQIGARITRRVRITASLAEFLHQFVDNFQIAPLVEGACCLPDGTCELATTLECVGLYGTFHGGGSECGSIPACPPPAEGACCLQDGTCFMDWGMSCALQDGTYHGDGTTCASIPPCPRSISTSFVRRALYTSHGAGCYLTVTALDPEGITIESFDFLSDAPVGTQIGAHVYYRPDTYIGFEEDEQAWTHLGDAFTTSEGRFRQRTPLDIGGLHIPHGETVALRIGAWSGGIIFENAANTTPVHANSHIQLDLGSAQNGFFFGTLAAPRGWNGTIYYSIGESDDCYANCDGSTTEPILNVDDFTCFINKFAAAQVLPHEEQIEHYANCDGSTIAPVLNVDDFTCFINAFAEGCP